MHAMRPSVELLELLELLATLASLSLSPSVAASAAATLLAK